MGTNRVVPAVLWLPLALLVVAPADAQTFSAGYETQDWRYPAFERFHGGLARVAWESGFEVAAEIGEARWRGGSPCAGDPVPPACRIRDRFAYGTESLSLWIGFEALSVDVPGGALVAVPGAGWSGVRYWKSLGGEDQLTDSHALLEAGLGLGYRAPHLFGSRGGLFIEYRMLAGASMAANCADCVDPVHGRMDRRTLSMGFSLGG